MGKRKRQFYRSSKTISIYKARARRLHKITALRKALHCEQSTSSRSDAADIAPHSPLVRHSSSSPLLTTQSVKLETEGSHCTQSSSDAAVKQEIEVSPTVLQPTYLPHMIMQPIKEEPQQMEEDSACSNNTPSSPETARAVKQEFDVGLSVLQPTYVQYIKIEPIKDESEQASGEDTRDEHVMAQVAFLAHKKD